MRQHRPPPVEDEEVLAGSARQARADAATPFTDIAVLAENVYEDQDQAGGARG
ncbi:hypothetical protein [Trinickia terrae]|uniref:hypothetical protein n=1 Tax=Trinickia terrae TaxID=2571161 RepID=UPI00146AE88C|nr:hypothetical protein [Trinickia terrae]